MTRTNCKWLHVLTHILRLTNLTRKLTERARNKKKWERERFYWQISREPREQYYYYAGKRVNAISQNLILAFFFFPRFALVRAI